MTVVALVVAAGAGVRFGAGTPKQYRPLAGRPILRYSLETFARHPAVDRVRAVINPAHRARYEAAAAGLDIMPPVHGATTRQGSCRAGLNSLAGAGVQLVLIHDAARPLVSALCIGRVLAALDRYPAALPVLPVADSLKRSADGGVVDGTADRAGLWRAQTPQGFRYEPIRDAHNAALAKGLTVTDDVAVAAAHGLGVAMTEGEERNLKITTEDDMRLATAWLGVGQDIRVGSGFDVHAFGPGDRIRLCGVTIPHDRGLAGHSDGDAGLHAVTDAILGAMAAGDIGRHFPAGDPAWRGADSAVFLRHAVALARDGGATLRCVDLTLICASPRLAGWIDPMRVRLAEILQMPVAVVSVKATTTDGLGFTGRDEGIAAQATVTVAVA